MQQMQAMGAPQMGQANDSAKIFQSEKEFLEISLHEFALNGVEAKLLKKWRESQK